MDTPGGMGVDDASMYVSSEEIMAFINDGGVEMASLFQPSTEFTLNHQTLDGGRGTSFGPGSPYSKPDSNMVTLRRGKSMMGFGFLASITTARLCLCVHELGYVPVILYLYH